VTRVPQSKQLLDSELPLPEPLPPLDDDPLPDGDIDSVELLLLDELLPLELLPLPDVPPPDVPPPPLDDPPPPLDEPPPPDELPPPPLEEGEPSVLLIDELDGLLDGVAVSVLLSEELDAVSVELGVAGVSVSLDELGLSLLLRLDEPLPGGCCVVAHTGIYRKYFGPSVVMSTSPSY
jgi:hypothetical protein